MKYIFQISIILLVSFVGELLNTWIPLPIPASIYGLLLMLLLLSTGILKVDHIRETADFLLKIMPVLFIPAIVGLIDVGEILLPILIPMLVVLVVTTYLVMGAAGLATEGSLRLDRRKKK